MKAKGGIQQKFQKKTHIEHILLRPDTYIGSTEITEESLFVYCKDAGGIVERKIRMNWGLYKIFDEILVNAADNSQRKARMTFINVQVKTSTGEIVIENDGEAIPVVFHKKQKVFIPEMIFGMLLSGSNFDDSVKKTVGGRNGYGCKLANIYSQNFEVLIHDQRRKKTYLQKWSRNMSRKSEPEISDWVPGQGDSLRTRSTRETRSGQLSRSSRRRKRVEESDYNDEEEVESASQNLVRISFKPDLERFGMKRISADLCALMHKRVIDIKAFVGRSVKVTFNRKVVKCSGFESYVKMHMREDESNAEIKCKQIRKGFDLGIGVSSEGFKQVSMVNGINTLKGGTHVKYVLDQLMEGLLKQLTKQFKLTNLKPFIVKNNLFLFINCLVENPAFGSQTKETLKTKKDSLAYLKIPDRFVKSLLKFDPLIQRIVQESRVRESNALTRAMNVKPRNKRDLLKIIKLEDANWAGTSRAGECTLILTEGDSAKSLAMAGLDVVGRDKWGVFPLRGKLINVRNAKSEQIKNNKEIKDIMKIMGFIMGRDYSKSKNRRELRYGGLMIMADQDVDGSHIKGLIINFVMYYWPSLAKKPGFIRQFVTPLIKVDFKAQAAILQQTRGQLRSGILDPNEKKAVFFTLSDFKHWYDSLNETADIKSIKYYKGLGTSTDKEARAYFKNIKSHIKHFFYSGFECKDAIEMAFDSNQITNRKIWLTGGRADQTPDYSVVERVSFKDFVDGEMMQYSIANLERSIPNILDGLKPSKRKILFSCFKRNLTGEIKVAQLSGYVAEHSAYHHGEMSLNQTIISMAQNFVGSNNVNLLEPLGQFGSRYFSGQEAASPRYIFTRLARLTRFLFRSDDDPLLTRLEEEGQLIEPVTYLPIVPMILVNGAEGIGTGWSTCVPKYNLLDLVDNIRRRLKGKRFRWIKPYYRHFLGVIAPLEGEGKCEGSEDFEKCRLGFDAAKFTCSGILKQSSANVLDVLELPVGVWTRKYKKFLNDLIEKEDATAPLENFEEFHTRSNVHFRLIFRKSQKISLSSQRAFWMKKLRLTTGISLSNLVLFNSSGRLTHYKNILEIFREFFKQRFALYKKRQQHLLLKTLRDFRDLTTKIAFLELILSKKVDIGALSQDSLVASIAQHQMLGKWSNPDAQSSPVLREILATGDLVEGLRREPMSQQDIEDKLLSMKISQLTADRREALERKLAEVKTELVRVFRTTPEEMWMRDLDRLEEEYVAMMRRECQELDTELGKRNSDQAGWYSRHFEQNMRKIGQNGKVLRKRDKVDTRARKRKSSGPIEIIEISSQSERQKASAKSPILDQNLDANNLKRVKKHAHKSRPKRTRVPVPRKLKTEASANRERVQIENSIEEMTSNRPRKVVIMSDSESD